MAVSNLSLISLEIFMGVTVTAQNIGFYIHLHYPVLEITVSVIGHCLIKSFTAKQKDVLTSFLIFNVLETKIFQYDFFKGHYV